MQRYPFRLDFYLMQHGAKIDLATSAATDQNAVESEERGGKGVLLAKW
jgi:hypothetical protein